MTVVGQVSGHSLAGPSASRSLTRLHRRCHLVQAPQGSQGSVQQGRVGLQVHQASQNSVLLGDCSTEGIPAPCWLWARGSPQPLIAGGGDLPAWQAAGFIKPSKSQLLGKMEVIGSCNLTAEVTFHLNCILFIINESPGPTST